MSLVSGFPPLPLMTDPVLTCCQNWTTKLSASQLRFDCGGFTNGTSGGPFLANVSPATGNGQVVGVVGGYQQGGDTPAISYSPTFGQNVAALYRTAVALS